MHILTHAHTHTNNFNGQFQVFDGSLVVCQCYQGVFSLKVAGVIIAFHRMDDTNSVNTKMPIVQYCDQFNQ